MASLRVTPAPSGGAAHLLFALPPGVAPLIYATLTPEPPELGAPEGARLVLDANGTYYEAENPFVALDTSGLCYYQCLDFDPALSAEPVYYHLFDPDGVTTARLDAREPNVSAFVGVVRDFVRVRLAHHVAYAVRQGRFPLRGGMKRVEIYEQDSLAKDTPLPALLLKESLFPAGTDGIGKLGDVLPDGTLERRFRYRCRIDLLVVADTAAERTALANLIHAGILGDFTLFEDAGYTEVAVNRTMTSGVTPDGRVQFGEEITLDGVVVMVVQERGRYRVGELWAEARTTPLGPPVLPVAPQPPPPAEPPGPPSYRPTVLPAYRGFPAGTAQARTEALIDRLEGLTGPAALASLTHVQTTPAAEWLVPLPWGVRPAAVTVEVGGQLVVPDVREFSASRVVLAFAEPTTGTVSVLKG